MAIDEGIDPGEAAAEGELAEELIVAPRTEGELVVPDLKEEEPDFSPFRGAGMNAVTVEQAESLMQIFTDEEHDIKPSGEVFIPQVHIRRRLNQVFRPGGWAMVEMSDIKRTVGKSSGKITIVQKYHMIVNGNFIAAAWGEQDYFADNENMTEATALEGAKSNAIVRCAKDLSIGWECWNKRWDESWKKGFATHVWAMNTSKGPKQGKVNKFWRRKDASAFEYPWSEEAAKEHFKKKQQMASEKGIEP